MKKIKILKKLLVGILVSLFAVTSVNAETVQVGNINIDLDSRMNSITGADDSFLDDLTTKAYTFTSSEAVSIDIANGTIYGTKDKPIKPEYTNRNLEATNVDIINVAYNMQKKITLDKYTFVNKVPDSINIPVPMYIQESIDDPDGWSYSPPTPEGATNSKVEITGLRDKMTNAGTIGSYTYESGSWKYLIMLNTTAMGVDATSHNEISWQFNVPFETKYTVDIAPITEGGNPEISGLTCGVTSLENNVTGNNSDYFKDGEINTSVDGGDTMEIGDIANLGEDVKDNTVAYNGMRECGTYDSDYEADYNPDDDYYVDYVNIDIYDPYTGELKETKENLTPKQANEIIANGLVGKTEIRVAYTKEAPKPVVHEETPKVENPLTADTIVVLASCFTIAFVALFVTTKVKKYNK